MLPRVVVVLPNGLRKIVGVFDPEIHQAKSMLEWTSQEDGSKICALLVSARPRIVLYRETHEPPQSHDHNHDNRPL